MSYPGYIHMIHEIRQAYQRPESVTDEQLRDWVQVASSYGDNWTRSQLTRLLIQLHSGDKSWGEVALGWLYESAKEGSWWTADLTQLVLQGWMDLLIHSSVGAAIAELHPRGVAQGLVTSILEGTTIPDKIPNIWLGRLVAAADARPPYDQLAVVELLSKARPKEPRWGFVALKWLNERRRLEPQWAARMVQIVVTTWPSLVNSEYSVGRLQIDPKFMARALSFALLKGWLTPSQVPPFLATTLESLARINLQQLSVGGRS